MRVLLPASSPVGALTATPEETGADSTFGPGFPVGPRAPLEPRGPCREQKTMSPSRQARGAGDIVTPGENHLGKLSPKRKCGLDVRYPPWDRAAREGLACPRRPAKTVETGSGLVGTGSRVWAGRGPRQGHYTSEARAIDLSIVPVRLSLRWPLGTREIQWNPAKMKTRSMNLELTFNHKRESWGTQCFSQAGHISMKSASLMHLQAPPMYLRTNLQGRR